MLNQIKGSGIPSQTLKLVDDPHAAELFVDELSGISHVNGTCSLTFARVAADHSTVPSRNYRKVCAGLRTTIPGLVGMHAAIGQMLKELEKQGIMIPMMHTPPNLHPVQ
jgi:hypothetical protein